MAVKYFSFYFAYLMSLPPCQATNGPLTPDHQLFQTTVYTFILLAFALRTRVCSHSLVLSLSLALSPSHGLAPHSPLTNLLLITQVLTQMPLV